MNWIFVWWFPVGAILAAALIAFDRLSPTCQPLCRKHILAWVGLTWLGWFLVGLVLAIVAAGFYVIVVGPWLAMHNIQPLRRFGKWCDRAADRWNRWWDKPLFPRRDLTNS